VETGRCPAGIGVNGVGFDVNGVDSGVNGVGFGVNAAGFGVNAAGFGVNGDRFGVNAAAGFGVTAGCDVGVHDPGVEGAEGAEVVLE
jgi:hypothetical protein